MEQTPVLEVKMLGGFSLRYGGRPLALERTYTTKAMQALQLLLYHGAEGVARDTLLDTLYGDDAAAQPANNLKVTVSKLRRLLVAGGLPPDTTVRFFGGCYRWCCTVPQTVDVTEFLAAANAARAAPPEQRAACLQTACERYGGEFLPHLQSEPWAAAAAAALRERYFTCVQGLTRIWRTQGEWTRLLPWVTRAAALYGMEEFQLARIDCLTHLERYTEAKRVYEEAVRTLREEFDVPPSEALLQRCRQMNDAQPLRADTLQDFQQALEEQSTDGGAYYCAYPGFIDAYRAVRRVMQRAGRPACLVLCWLTDTRGRPLADRKKAAVAAARLHGALRLALRQGDVYTQPARDRFLILLSGTEEKEMDLILQRIRETYRAQAVRGVGVCFRAAAVGGTLSSSRAQAQGREAAAARG